MPKLAIYNKQIAKLSQFKVVLLNAYRMIFNNRNNGKKDEIF